MDTEELYFLAEDHYRNNDIEATLGIQQQISIKHHR